MILKINQDEILDIVSFCSEKLYACQHELRTPYISTYENMAWNQRQLMEPEECRKMEEELEKSGFPVIMDIHSRAELAKEEPQDERSDVQVTETGEDKKTKAWQSQMDEIVFCMHPEFFFLRFHPSGTCTLNVTKETFSIADMEHPEECYREKLRMLCERRARAFLWEKGFASVTARKLSMKVILEELEATKAGLMIRGWHRAENREADENLLMVTVKGEDHQCWNFLTFPISRPDLDRGDGQTQTGGFALYLGRNIVTSQYLTLEFLFVRKETMEKAYSYEYPYCIKFPIDKIPLVY